MNTKTAVNSYQAVESNLSMIHFRSLTSSLKRAFSVSQAILDTKLYITYLLDFAKQWRSPLFQNSFIKPVCFVFRLSIVMCWALHVLETVPSFHLDTSSLVAIWKLHDMRVFPLCNLAATLLGTTISFSSQSFFHHKSHNHGFRKQTLEQYLTQIQALI